VQALEAEVDLISDYVAQVDEPAVQDYLFLALSHSLATKVSLRWMGTGGGRFAVEVASRLLLQIFLAHIHMMLSKTRIYRAFREQGWLRRPGTARFQTLDASGILVEDGSVHAVVTSPPYLPASSGRETYLRSRAVSLVALNLLTGAEIMACER
jgi:hypothetical protein